MNIVKSILAISMSIISIAMIGQSVEQKTIANLKSESVTIESNYPDIELKSWEGNDIKIESNVMINGEEHNGAFILETKNATNGIYIDAKVNTESLKQKVIVNNKDGSKSYFDTKGFDNLNFGDNGVSMNIGYNIDAQIIIWIPSSMKVITSTVYGDIKSKGFFANLKIKSTYGMIEAELLKVDKMERLELFSTYDIVDLTIDPKINANLNMSTSYGEIYSDLNLVSKNSSQNNQCGNSQKYILNDGGLEIKLVSTYENVYIRAEKSL